MRAFPERSVVRRKKKDVWILCKQGWDSVERRRAKKRGSREESEAGKRESKEREEGKREGSRREIRCKGMNIGGACVQRKRGREA